MFEPCQHLSREHSVEGVWCFGHVEEERVGEEMMNRSVEQSRRRHETCHCQNVIFGLCFFHFFGFRGLF